MTYVFILLAITIAFVILFYTLWIKGYLIIKRKTAKKFIGSVKFRRRLNIKFTSCNGYIKKVLKIKESRNYLFSFESIIEKGNVTVEILDRSKEKILQLDRSNLEKDIFLDKNSRYYLVLRFENADGELDLSWN